MAPPPGNAPPVAVDDSVMTVKGQGVVVSVLANDSDPNGDALTVTGVTQPAHGYSVASIDGTTSYAPMPGFSGTDSYTYTIRDPAGATATATVTVQIAGDPPPPSAGWTDFPVAAGAQIIYVSSSTGQDGPGRGLTEATALRTVRAGYEMLRDRSGDHLRLKRGDTWINEDFGDAIGGFRKTGASATSPIVIEAYGTGERPLLRSIASGLFRCGYSMGNLAVVGIHFMPNAPLEDIVNGFEWICDSDGRAANLWIEDCLFEKYVTNIDVQDADHIKIRRNVIADSYKFSFELPASQGIFAGGVDDLLMEENIFDSNGFYWENGVKKGSWFAHNYYIYQNSSGNVTLRRNIISNGSGDGGIMRSGGLVEDNVYTRNPNSLNVGFCSDGECFPGGVTATVRGNVIVESRNLQDGDAEFWRGGGMGMSNIGPSGIVVENNILANKLMPAIDAAGITFNGEHGVGIQKATFSNNIIYNWRGGFADERPSGQVHNIVFERNELQQLTPAGVTPAGWDSGALLQLTDINFADFTFRYNTYYTAPGNTGNQFDGSTGSYSEPTAITQNISSQYKCPDRTMVTYAQKLGFASEDALMAEVRKQSRQRWDARYTIDAILGYFRDGFTKAPRNCN